MFGRRVVLCSRWNLHCSNSLIAQQSIDDAALKGAGKARGDWLTMASITRETRLQPAQPDQCRQRERSQWVWSQIYALAAAGRKQRLWYRTGSSGCMTNWSVAFAIDARTGKELWRWDPGGRSPIDDARDDSVCVADLRQSWAGLHAWRQGRTSPSSMACSAGCQNGPCCGRSAPRLAAKSTPSPWPRAS